jgi:hypothetical protein
MATGLLFLGYLLLEPPLIGVRRMWTRRVWTMYWVEIAGALLVAWGWALLGWPVVTTVTLAWALLFGLAFPLHVALEERHGTREPE